MNSAGRFDGKGEIYAEARPGYPETLFDFLEDTMRIPRGSSFADIGAGTGIFSELLLRRGNRVYAVEPNTDMRRKAEEKLGGLPGFASLAGFADRTTLPTQSVDGVTAAQAFHWFDAESFRAECRRILRPGGKVVIIYNVREANAPCNRALARVHRRYCPEFRGFSGGMSEERCRSFFGGSCDRFRVDNSRVYDRRGFVNRALSSSYSLREGEAQYPAYLAELNRVFDEFSRNGFVTVPVTTVAYGGSV